MCLDYYDRVIHDARIVKWETAWASPGHATPEQRQQLSQEEYDLAIARSVTTLSWKAVVDCLGCPDYVSGNDHSFPNCGNPSRESANRPLPRIPRTEQEPLFAVGENFVPRNDSLSMGGDFVDMDDLLLVFSASFGFTVDRYINGIQVWYNTTDVFANATMTGLGTNSDGAGTSGDAGGIRVVSASTIECVDENDESKTAAKIESVDSASLDEALEVVQQSNGTITSGYTQQFLLPILGCFQEATGQFISTDFCNGMLASAEVENNDPQILLQCARDAQNGNSGNLCQEILSRARDYEPPVAPVVQDSTSGTASFTVTSLPPPVAQPTAPPTRQPSLRPTAVTTVQPTPAPTFAPATQAPIPPAQIPGPAEPNQDGVQGQGGGSNGNNAQFQIPVDGKQGCLDLADRCTSSRYRAQPPHSHLSSTFYRASTGCE